ncbi:MAG: hypothetical protein H6823_03475 [Planctomycetaceae bacterium]|nr:hypothetical protein [Planctomycetales bacterium]MCB9937279.1 hypothetical protein [Planctomycetaceae bacterium]
MTTHRLLGVTVMPEYLQSESVDAVLDRLQEIGVNSITTSPYVMEHADEATGGREPPIDAGAGKVRLLDRPLWGHRELFVRTSPSFEPDKRLYEGLAYQPSEPDELTQREGSVIDELIAQAHTRGIQVYFQVMSAIPPGYRVQFGGPREDDKPRMPDGTVPQRRVANNASLASRNVIDYKHAMIRDLCQRYPQLDGIRFDWPEYPPYSLDDMFVDFSDHARAAAQRHNIDFEMCRRDTKAFYEALHGGLTDVGLSSIAHGDAEKFVADGLARYEGVMEMIVLKTLLSGELLAGFRQTMNDCGAKSMAMQPNAFPPPWSRISGFDFGLAAQHSQGISVKLYGMHWAMMLRSYGEQLLAANPDISELLLVRALVTLLGIEDGEGSPKLEDYRYPAPDEPHPGGDMAQASKISQAQMAAGECPVYTLAHGYGPEADFQRRFEVAWNASPHGVWLNRYGYLSDAKLKIVGSVANC